MIASGVESLDGFNPRTRESATCATTCLVPGTLSFNPRTRESATIPTGAEYEFRSFNPRTRESATRVYNARNVVAVVSIHALVRVRPNREGFTYSFIMFQSTHS